jgi:hypothetical protein
MSNRTLPPTAPTATAPLLFSQMASPCAHYHVVMSWLRDIKKMSGQREAAVEGLCRALMVNAEDHATTLAGLADAAQDAGDFVLAERMTGRAESIRWFAQQIGIMCGMRHNPHERAAFAFPPEWNVDARAQEFDAQGGEQRENGGDQ